MALPRRSRRTDIRQVMLSTRPEEAQLWIVRVRAWHRHHPCAAARRQAELDKELVHLPHGFVRDGKIRILDQVSIFGLDDQSMHCSLFLGLDPSTVGLAVGRQSSPVKLG